MQPKSLILQNFGPFVHETIDFSTLSEAPLFLISGKTGAGKTTIFDAMTYALFGDTSGKYRKGKEMRSLFASPTEETVVTFHFEHQGINYCIERKPDQLIAKKRGDGYKTQAAKVQLIIHDIQGNETKQLSKNGEVAEFIKELLHLDEKQFLQIVLLPQGEFRNFLLSDSKAKEELLRNLFGTQLYQKLNELLKEKLKAKQQQLDHLEQTMRVLETQFQGAKKEEAGGWLSFEETTAEWLEIQETVRVKIQQAEEELLQLRVKEKQATDAFYQAKRQNDQLQELVLWESRRAELEKKRPEMAEKEAWLQRYQAAEKLLPMIQQYQELEQKQERLSNQLLERQQTIAQLSDTFTQWKAKAGERKSEQQKIDDLQKELDQVLVLLPLAEKQQQLRTLLAEKNTRVDEVTEQFAHEKQALEHTKIELLELSQVLDQEEELQDQRLALETIRQLEQQWKATRADCESTEEILKQTQEAEQALADKLEPLKGKLIRCEEEKAKVKSQWAKLQIAQLQLLLIPGEACPVCGSTEHPAVEIQGEFGDDEINVVSGELEQLEQRADQLKEELTQQEILKETTSMEIKKLRQQKLKQENQQAAVEQKLLQTLQKSFPSINEEGLTKLISSAEQQVEQSLRSLKEAKEQQNFYQQKMAEAQSMIEKLGSDHQKIREEAQHYQGQLDGLEQQLKKKTLDGLSEKADSLKADIEQCSVDLQETLRYGEELSTKLEILRASHAQQQQQVEEQKQELERMQQGIDDQLDQMSFFSSIDEVCTYKDARQQAKRLEAEITEFQRQDLLIHDRWQQLSEATKGCVQTKLDELENERIQVVEQLEELQTEIMKKKEMKLANDTVLSQYSALYETSQKQLDELSEWQQLSQTVNGENPKKTSLERYVLQVYLQEVLQVANERLQRLTNNRYQFELSDMIGSYRGKTGLEINVYDDEAGMSRGANTLSGGESFIAALALALGMAEVIQAQSGGIAIDALFIDEGFGSLDEESLEMAMEALETIENEGRMIGIISHVKELKERIPQQIQIRTNGNGQSRIEYQLS